jgi:hypothetical protein
VKTPLVALTEEQQKAIAALNAAERWARSLTLLFTPTHLLADDIDNDEFFFGVEALAKQFFGGGLDFEQAVIERTGWDLSDPRLIEFNDLQLEERHAAQLAAFAMGVAWSQGTHGQATKRRAA